MKHVFRVATPFGAYARGDEVSDDTWLAMDPEHRINFVRVLAPPADPSALEAKAAALQAEAASLDAEAHGQGG